MANDYSGALQQLIAKIFLKARAEAVASRLVNRSLDPRPSGLGKQILVNIPTNYTATQVTPGFAPTGGQDSKPTQVAMTLDQHWEVPVVVSDADLAAIPEGSFDAEADSMAVALVEKVNSSIYEASKKFWNVVGVAGTNPFATNEDVILAANQALDTERTSSRDRVTVITPAAKAKALKIAAFTRVDARGDGQALITGKIGDVFGLGVFWDQLIYRHVSTPLSGGAATVNGAHAVGAGSTDGGRTGTVSIAKATATSPLVKGDVLTFAGDSQTYIVQADITLAVGNTTVAIAPALRASKAGAEAVTLTATHDAMPVMHKDAITFASRKLDSLKGIGNLVSRVDAQTGLAITIELERQHYQSKMKVSCLWAVDSFRPEFGVRMLG